MYSDYEVECMYLGKPFEEKIIHADDLRDRVIPLRNRDETRMLPAHPLISLLAGAAR